MLNMMQYLFSSNNILYLLSFIGQLTTKRLQVYNSFIIQCSGSTIIYYGPFNINYLLISFSKHQYSFNNCKNNM